MISPGQELAGFWDAADQNVQIGQFNHRFVRPRVGTNRDFEYEINANKPQKIVASFSCGG